MKVLVTGATGFIGAALVDALLEQEHDVSVVSRKLSHSNSRISVHNIDLLNSDFKALQLTDYDVIFNCAGELKDKEKMRALHVEVPLRMLSFLKGAKCRWVQLSSVGVYGKQMSGDITENTSFEPEGDYEVTKAEAEQQVVSYCSANDINYSILRPSNVIGPEMPNDSMRNLVRTIARGRFFYMAEPSKVQMNFVHVDNVVSALMLCGFVPGAVGNAFNISDQISQKQFVEQICHAVNRSTPKIYIPAGIIKLCVYLLGWLPKFPFGIAAVNALTTQAVYSTEKIETQLGFKKNVSLEKAIDAFI